MHTHISCLSACIRIDHFDTYIHTEGWAARRQGAGRLTYWPEVPTTKEGPTTAPKDKGLGVSNVRV